MRFLNILKYEIKCYLRPIYRRLRGFPPYLDEAFEPNLPLRKVKKILRRNGLSFDKNGIPSWWYKSHDGRNSLDELVKAELNYIINNIPKEADVLETGCGTGLMQMWLVQKGYLNVEGFDYLDNVIASAKEIAKLAGLKINVWQADGFKPNLSKQYDLIMVLHWLYSAWEGNYGNQPLGNQDREVLLDRFLSQYQNHLRSGGLMLIELVDAISDFAYPPSAAYPIRHTYEQVSKVALSNNMSVKHRIFNSKYGILPRMMYVLEKK